MRVLLIQLNHRAVMVWSFVADKQTDVRACSRNLLSAQSKVRLVDRVVTVVVSHR